MIGPFRATTDTYYSEQTPWRKENWKYHVEFEPLLHAPGIVSGRELLDLIVDVGKMSVRDPAALSSYWIHTLIMSEADEMLNAFLERARFSWSEIKSKYIKENINIGKIDKRIHINNVLLQNICSKNFSKHPEWIIEAIIARSRKVAGRLSPFSNPLSATGVYVYEKKFLDVIIYNSGIKWATVIEVKNSLNDKKLLDASEQIAYYAYTIHKALDVPSERMLLTIATLDKPSRSIMDKLTRVVYDRVSEYGLRDDRIALLTLSFDYSKCRDENVNLDDIVNFNLTNLI